MDDTSRGWGLLLGHQRGPHMATSGDFVTAVDSRRANADPDQNLHGLRSCSGGTPVSRHLAESHPQVLIIAPGAYLRVLNADSL